MTIEETEGLIDLVRRTKEAEVSAVLKETPDGVRVSLRSVTEVDVSAVAASFGGGGHRYAAGFTSHASLASVQAALREAVAVAVKALHERDVTDGFVVVDKPVGWTSHDAVARCRKVFAQKRVGHAGTLDPDATGVLLVGLGRATRLLKFVGDLEKAYVGDVVLGTATNTLDASGEVTGTWDMAGVTRDDVSAAATKFVGDIEQIPPMVSAVQVDGQRLHALARKGIEVERKPRPVTIHSLDVIGAPEPGVFTIDVVCSTGTYIRTLAADIGDGAGRGSAPAQSAATGSRNVHGGDGRAARGVDAGSRPSRRRVAGASAVDHRRCRRR